MKTLYTVAYVLLIIGGLNWLLTGLIAGWDLASFVTDGGARIVYILVGLATLVELYHLKAKKGANAQMSSPMGQM